MDRDQPELEIVGRETANNVEDVRAAGRALGEGLRAMWTPYVALFDGIEQGLQPLPKPPLIEETPVRKDYPRPILIATYAIVFTLVAAIILLVVMGAILLVRAVLG